MAALHAHGRVRDAEVPIIVRGDGCYLEDVHGKRYLDALAGLFSVNLGYSFGEEIGQAALEQMRELPFYTNWSYSHPRAIELAAGGGVARAGRPQPRLLRVRRLGGGRVGVEARAPVLRRAKAASGRTRRGSHAGAETRHDELVAAHRRSGATRRSRGTSRTTARRSVRSRSTASRPSGRRSSRSCPRCATCSNTNRYHRPPEETEEEFTAFLLDELERTILAMGPETVCLVHMEPVQNAGGAFVAAGGLLAAACASSARYDILLSADEVITGFGRVGHWFASERYDIRPDIVCCAKGLSSSYAAIGAWSRPTA